MYFRQSSLHWAVMPLLMGLVLGISLSSVLLLQPYRITNIYIGLQEDSEDYHKHLEQKLNDFQKLMDELHPGYLDSTKKSQLSEELTMKVPVQYTIVISKGATTAQLDAMERTWARDVEEGRLHYYYNSSEKSESLGVLRNSSHIATPLLSPSEPLEIQALRHICSSRKLNTSKWFFFGYSSSYIKVKELESYLLSLEVVQDQVLYLGRPIKRDKIGRICLPGPGTIFAYSVISEVCPKLSNCKERYDTEFTLGECMHRTLPEIQCRKDSIFQGLFLNFDAEKKGSIIDESNKDRLAQAFTIYPVTDPAHIFGIHQRVNGKRLNEYLYLLQELKQVEGHMLGLLPQAQSVKYNASHWKDESWELISQNLLMSTQNSNPAIPLQPFWKEEIRALTETTMEYLYSKEDTSYIFSKTGNIYFKLNPFTGMEYKIDFEVKVPQSEEKKHANAKHFQVALSRPLGSLEVSASLPLGEPKRIAILIVAAIKHSNLLKKFMNRMENVLRSDQRIDVVVVRMKAEEEKSQKVAILHRILHSYETRYLQATFRLIDTALPLSRARAIGKVLRELRPGDVLFLADLSFTFTTSFLERCRNIPVQGQQIFFPIPFSLFPPRENLNDSKPVKKGDQVKNVTEAVSVTVQSGHWLLGSHSACCLHVADLLTSVQKPGKKGIPKEIEIEELFNGVLEKRYEVIRGPDSGLVQEYTEDRACPLDVTGEALASCYGLPDLKQNIKRNDVSELLFDHEKGHAKYF